MGALSPNFVSGHIAFVKKKKKTNLPHPAFLNFLTNKLKKKRNYGIYHAS